jgi:nicotinate-nucleotide adenylyltransferase
MMNNPATGILSGIFDPVHNGHLATACFAKEHFNLGNMLFIPSGNPPHKRDEVIASSSDRLMMLHLALAGEPGTSILDNEIQRPGLSYTIDTILEIRSRYDQLYFVIGSDNLHEICSWYRYKELLGLITICVAHRPGSSLIIPSELAGADIRVFPSPEWGLSSTMLRSYLMQG